MSRTGRKTSEVTAKMKLAGCEKFGIRPCCFKETCTPTMSFRGPSPYDAANFFLGADGKQN